MLGNAAVRKLNKSEAAVFNVGLLFSFFRG